MKNESNIMAREDIDQKNRVKNKKGDQNIFL